MQNILTVKKLNVTLEGNHILENVSFSLEAGEILAIIGPNGSGKTILLKSLLNLVPYSGEIKWNNPSKENKKKISAPRIGYVPQKIDADRHLPITLEDLLVAKARILGLAENNHRETAKRVGLSENALHIPVGHLSGGQLQKGLIALALIGDPQIILLDEPTASLDQPAEEHIYELIHRLQEELNLTVIVVSHDLSMVFHKDHKILCLNKRALCFGDAEEVLNPTNLKQAFGASMDFYDHIHRNKKK